MRRKRRGVADRGRGAVFQQVVPPERFGFLRDQSATMLPVLSLLMTVTLEFLETGDGTGCRALILLPVVIWPVPKYMYGTVWFHEGTEDPGHEPGVLFYAMLLIQCAALHLATREGSRIQSTSPMYVKPQASMQSGRAPCARVRVPRVAEFVRECGSCLCLLLHEVRHLLQEPIGGWAICGQRDGREKTVTRILWIETRHKRQD